MAWQFYGTLGAGGHTYGVGNWEGPLPCKRWVKRPGDKKHKLSYRRHYSARIGGTNAGKSVHCGYGVGKRWFNAYAPIEVVAFA